MRRSSSFDDAKRDHQRKNLLARANLPRDVARGDRRLEDLGVEYRKNRGAAGVDPQRYDEIVQHVMNYVDEPTSGGIVFLSGDKGVGKTWILQCAAARSIWVHMRSSVYATTDHVFDAIREAMSDDKELTESEAVALYTLPHLLVFDDLGRGKMLTRWELGIVLRIIDERVRQNRPILAASNFNLPALAAVWGAGGEAETHNAKLICDRLADAKRALHLPMNGKSLRREK